MFEYDSVSTPTYDLAGLVSKLNERAAAGWDVVSIVPTGGDVTAILKRTKGGSTASDAAAVTESIPELEHAHGQAASAPADAAGVAAGSGAVAVGGQAADTTPPVSEPAGWAAAPADTTPAPATPEPTPAPAPEPTPAYTPEATPAYTPQPTPQPTPQAASVPTTPAGWYPDPSGRFELRYWDGNQWTEYVSRAGQQYTDPPVA